MDTILEIINVIHSRQDDINKLIVNPKNPFLDFVSQVYHQKAYEYQRFMKDEKFITPLGKKGTVRDLRDDDHEKKWRKGNKTHYRYSVAFEDGSYDTYQLQSSMLKEDEWKFLNVLYQRVKDEQITEDDAKNMFNSMRF